MAPNSAGQDRRTFLRLSAALAAAVASGGAAAALAQPAASPSQPSASAGDPEAGLLAGAVIVNALGQLEDPNVDLQRPPSPPGAAKAKGGTGGAGASAGDDDDEPAEIDARALREARASGLTAVNVTLGYVAGPQEPFEATVADIGVWDRVIRRHADDLLKVWTVRDILQARSDGKVGIIYGFQNAAMVGTDARRVDVFGNLGVRVIQLTYNPRNQLGDGSMVAENHGLTPLGRQVVERLNHNRIMVDLSHSGEQTCLDAARASRQPISINHTGCRALADLPRNKTDEELRLVASRGGFVGIYFMPFLTLSGHAHADDVVAHIDHAVSVCGEDHVGIGTDGPVTAIDDLEGYKAHLAKEVADRAAAGIGAKGERADTLPFVVDLRGVDQFRELARRLRQRGYSTARIQKILGGNFLRFAADVWGS